MDKELLSEKVSVNVNAATLSVIDLLVDNGFYSNRSDFINQALREAVTREQPAVDRITSRNKRNGKPRNDWFLGVYAVGNDTLAEMEAFGEKQTLRGYGVLIIDNGVDEELLFRTVEKIDVKGSVRCPERVREHYGLAKPKKK